MRCRASVDLHNRTYTAGSGAFSHLRFTVARGLAMIETQSSANQQGARDASRNLTEWRLAGALAFGLAACGTNRAAASAPSPAENAAPTADNAVMLTVFLKHDQSRPLSELNAQLQRQGYYKAFPPEGVEVVSWYVMMGIGQVVTLRLPASRLREVNRILENTAWGSYRTEFYPTYDYKAIGIAAHDKAQ